MTRLRILAMVLVALTFVVLVGCESDPAPSEEAPPTGTAMPVEETTTAPSEPTATVTAKATAPSEPTATVTAKATAPSEPTATVTAKATPTPESPTATPAVECVQQREKDALVAFYNSLDGPNWRSRTGWLSDRPLGRWRGVGTNSGGCVTSIELGGNDLSGTIPSEVGALSSLRVLDLSENNNITGALPPELGNLSNLETPEPLRPNRAE